MSAIAGLFRRGCAFLIDVIILFIFGFVVTAPFLNQLSRMGTFPLLFGIFVVSSYFTVSHTAWRSGQTLGKKILGIQVLSANGSFLTGKQAFFRSLDIIFFWFINDAIKFLGIYSFMSAEAYFIFGLPSSIILLSYCVFLPLHPLKLGLHDLYVRTVVVKKNTFDAQLLIQNFNPKREKTALFVSLFLLVVVTVGGWLFQKNLTVS